MNFNLKKFYIFWVLVALVITFSWMKFFSFFVILVALLALFVLHELLFRSIFAGQYKKSQELYKVISHNNFGRLALLCLFLYVLYVGFLIFWGFLSRSMKSIFNSGVSIFVNQYDPKIILIPLVIGACLLFVVHLDLYKRSGRKKV